MMTDKEELEALCCMPSVLDIFTELVPVGDFGFTHKEVVGAIEDVKASSEGLDRTSAHLAIIERFKEMKASRNA